MRYFNVAGAGKKLRTGLISKYSTHLIKIACEVATNKRKNLIINGSNYKSVKINHIRSLKNTILTTAINNKKRFIILDDVDLFNINSLNGLLKIIEEPSYNNFFILINNNSKPLLETIKSRCLEIKIILDVKRKKSIIDKLIKRFDEEIILSSQNFRAL